MPLRTIAVASVIVLAFAAMSASAQAQTRPNQSTAKTKKTEVQPPLQEPAPAPEERIACTVTGCHPIPANCTTTMGQTPMGATGYEIVHCP